MIKQYQEKIEYSKLNDLQVYQIQDNLSPNIQNYWQKIFLNIHCPLYKTIFEKIK
jgi:hypothetical protein